MASFFNSISMNSNPLTTPVGKLIEAVTDSNQNEEDWTTILLICDLINGHEDGPRDAMKAIRKRLQQASGSKSYRSVMLTLTLLEACVKNCDHRFHVLVCTRDFIQELIKIIGPKYDPPIDAQEKVLSLIQSWADAFGNQPDLSAVGKEYRELKSKGIEFPMTNLDSMAPIHTPRKTVVSTPQPALKPPARVQNARVESPNSEMEFRLSPEQLAKLKSELDLVQENMNIFSEMLTELVPGKEHASDLELLAQLNGTCKAMQARLVELISRLPDDSLTAELLGINDILNNLFLRYSRYEKNRNATIGTSENDIVPLIDLGTNDETDNKRGLLDDFSNLALGKNTTNGVLQNKPSGSGCIGNSPMKAGSSSSSGYIDRSPLTKVDPEFDMFAQSRNVTYESSKKVGSTYDDNVKSDLFSGSLGAAAQSRSQPASLMHTERDFDEMAAWLEEQEANAATDPTESLTSSEFDRFLAERAAAADSLPGDGTASTTATATTTTTSSTASSLRNRQPFTAS